MSTDPYARYDHAWKTPGWSVQNPSVNYYVDGYVDPGMPEDVGHVQVFGEFLELNSGRTLGGVLRLRVNKILVHVPSGRQVMPGPFRPIRFNRQGFSISLPATDDPELASQDGGPWGYEAVLTVGGRRQEFTFALPEVLGEVSILELIPSEPITGSEDGVLDGGTI